MGKKLLNELYFIFDLDNNLQYEYSNTYFLNLLPDFFLHLNNDLFYHLKYIVIVTTICASIGFLGRFGLLILAFLSFYILGITEGLGVFDHHLSLPSQVILILALVPGTMKISLDYAILRLHKILKKKPLKYSINPKWSVNLILLLLIITYFTAGVSKLRYGNGIKWLDGSTLSFYLKERTLKYNEGDIQLIIGNNDIAKNDKWKDKFGFIAHTYGNFQTLKLNNKIADYIANNKLLVITLSIGSLLFELLGFIVFINSKYRNIYLFSAILFHLSIGALMGISFRQYRLICFCLIDWNSLFKYCYKKLSVFKFLKQKLEILKMPT
ncbi:hypothetical protein N1F78_14625 [Seonamhaeicola sp. MEBiC1930]|uniref:hypothetical protein n=1 Tax=Seonamhaeicola sp. MEBiC01930 TaxID=2976768 RepID=UPI003251A0A1